MSRNLRLVLRSVGLSLVTVGFTCVLLIGWVLAIPMGKRVAWRAWVMRQWARACLVCMAIRVRTEGGAPRGPSLMVCNHLGYADILVIASQTGCRFVSKAEVRRWPVIGPLSKLAGTVYVNREQRKDVKRVGGEIGAAVEEGSVVVFFPEGTSTQGARVEPFRSSLLEPAAAAKLPVHFATLSYGTPEAEVSPHLSVAWWGDMSLAPHLLDFLRLERIDASLIFGAAPLEGSDRKLLAERLHAAVAAPFVPMPRDEAAAAPLS